MLTLTPQMRIFLAVEAIDFRNGIDGLAGMCLHKFGCDPFGGGVFVFRNRRGTSLKILVYDGQGFWLCQKRLSSGRFCGWPTCSSAGTAANGVAGSTAAALECGSGPCGTRAAVAKTGGVKSRRKKQKKRAFLFRVCYVSLHG